MWVLDAHDIVNQQGSTVAVISYNTTSLQKLRQAFKTAHDGYKAIAEAINKFYNDATKRYQDPLNQEPLFSIETPLRKIQNFMFAYQGVFYDWPVKVPAMKSF